MKKKLRTRIGSICLVVFVLLNMLPMVALAAAPTGVWVSGTQITADGYWINDGHGGITAEGATADNYNVKYDGNGTLTLKAAKLTPATPLGEGADAAYIGVYSSESLTLTLEGENTVSANTLNSGVLSMGTLTVNGTGSLTVTLNTAQSTGLAAGTGLTVSGAAVTVTSTDERIIGLVTTNGNLTVTDANIMVNSGLYGLYTVDSGTVSIGGTSVVNVASTGEKGCGVFADGGVTIADTARVTAAATGENSCGVAAGNNISVTGTAILSASGTFAAAAMQNGELTVNGVAQDVTGKTTLTVEGGQSPVGDGVNTAQEFIAAIEQGGEIQLTGNIDLTEALVIDSSVNLDLNGYTISSKISSGYLFALDSSALTITDRSEQKEGAISVPNAKAIEIKGTGSVFTLEAGTISAKQDTVEVASFASDTVCHITGGKITAEGGNKAFGAYGYGTVVNMSGGEIEMQNGTNQCFYLSGMSADSGVTLNMTGGKMTSSAAGVYISNYATLNISGEADIESTGSQYGALYIGAYNQSHLSDINISGGTIKSARNYAIYAGPNSSNYCDVEITGGQILSDNSSKTAIKINSKVDLTITAGTFTGDVSSYISKSSTFTTDATGNMVVNPNTESDSYAAIGDRYYKTLGDAIEEAETGDTILLLKDIAERDPLVIEGKTITLDLNSYKITNGSDHTITVKNGAGLTINGTGTVDNVTHQKAAIWNEGTVILNGGVYTRSRETGSSPDVSGENSYYNIVNHGAMTINSGVSVTQNGSFSSMIENGYTNYSSDNASSGYVEGTNAANPELIINGGTFDGGLNTIKNDDGGKLTIENGTFTNTTQATVLNWNIATIKGGTFTARSGNCILNGAYSITAAGQDLGQMTITGGTFTAPDGASCIVNYFNGSAPTVSGGTFSSDPSTYVDPGSIAKRVDSEGGYTYEVISKSNLTAGTYMSDPTGATASNYYVRNNNDGTWTVYYSAPSSGGGSSSSGNKTETVTNPDGSTTTTVTKPDGSTTETTKNPDGSTEVVDTKKDGTVTTTTTDATGNKTETVEKTDGTSQTTVTNKDGSSSTTTVSKDGQAETQVKLPADLVSDAADKDEAVSLPMPEVSATTDETTAPTVTVDLPSGTTAKVEIPVENVTPGTVAILVKDDGTEEIVKDSVVTENGLTLTVADGAKVRIVDRSIDFIDVRDGYWAEDEIDFVSSRELFTGTSANTFSPEGVMTRAMLMTVLARYEGVDTTTGDTWYEVGVAWAMENGISDGTNLDASVTREQLATMLYRYVGEPEVTGTLNGFADAGSVSDWAKEGLTWAVENGLINGMGDGSLNPQGTANRAQVAAILARFVAMAH